MIFIKYTILLLKKLYVQLLSVIDMYGTILLKKNEGEANMANSEQVHEAPSRKKIVIAGAVTLVVCVAAFIVFWLSRAGELEARIIKLLSFGTSEESIM